MYAEARKNRLLPSLDEKGPVGAAAPRRIAMNPSLPLAMLIDPWTYALVAIVALLLFGKRLPEVGRSLGKGIAEFKKGLHDVRSELDKEEPPAEPPRRLRPPEQAYDTLPRPATTAPPAEANAPGMAGTSGTAPQTGDVPGPGTPQP